jgi:hypothetical protein
VTSVEQALLFRLGLAVLREHEVLEHDLKAGQVGAALIDATAEVRGLLDIWLALRFAPSGAMLLYPSDEAYEPGTGPCPACREPGEGGRCDCLSSYRNGEPTRYLTKTRAALLPIITDSGAECSRSRCPQYLVQPSIPGLDGTARAVCAMTGTSPGRYCAPRALDIVEQVHAREVARRP